MKLSITHLAPYLPYGLKGIAYVSKDIALDYVDIIGCNRSELYCEYTSEMYKNMSGARKLFDLYEVKPLLIPISSLYTEMEDGTVPIVELARIAVDYEWGLGKHYCDGLYIDAAESIYDIFYYNESHKVFELANIYGIGGVAPNQLDLFTYLFSHHFDVFSLIDKGLAIDKTKIK